MTTKQEDSPANRVLQEIEYRLRTSRSRFEIELLRAILLSCGITTLRNKTNRTYAVKQ